MANSGLRVMLDTNVQISAVYNPDSIPGRVTRTVGTDYSLVICGYIIRECHEVITRKFPHRIGLFEILLEQSGLEIYFGDAPFSFPISDPKDQPILNAAVAAGVDILVSGDKHFKSLDIIRPRVLSPVEFLELINKVSI